MACLIDQEVVFGDGYGAGLNNFTDIDYSNYVLTVGSVDLYYYDKDEEMKTVAFLSGEDYGSSDLVAVIGYSTEGDGGSLYARQGYEPYTPLDGTYSVKLCEKSSDSDGSCPDVPFSESAPEQYADYFDEDGNFVPKASSSGNGDCPFTTATLRIVDENGEQPEESRPDISFYIPFIRNGELLCIIPDLFGDYTVPLYNGEISIQIVGDILSYSGNIEMGIIAFLTGDATISVPTISST